MLIPKFTRVVLAPILLALAGCAPQTPGGADVSGGGGSAEVRTIKLEDGTRCAVLVGYQKAALSCDWEN